MPDVYDDIDALVLAVRQAAIAAAMRYWAFEGNVADGFQGYRVVNDADEVLLHIGYPGGEVTVLNQPYDSFDGDLLFDPVSLYASTGELIDLAFFPWLKLPDPTPLWEVVHSMQKAASLLTGGGVVANGQGAATTLQVGNASLFADADYVRTEISQYNSMAIEALEGSYTKRLPSVIGGQQLLATLVGVVVAGEAEVWKHARVDVAGIATDAKTAFDSYTGPGGGFGGLTRALEVVGAVASAVGLFTTGGVAAGVGALATSTGVVNTFLKPPDTEPEVRFSGGSVHEIWESVMQALADTSSAISAQESAFQHCAMDATGTVTEQRGAFDFGTPTAFLKIHDVKEIFLKGEDHLHLRDVAARLQGVAGTLREARQVAGPMGGFGPWSRPGSIGLGPEGHYFAASQLHDLWIDTLTTSAKAMHDVADHMVAVAHDFEETDAQVGHELHGLVKEIPDPDPVSLPS